MSTYPIMYRVIGGTLHAVKPVLILRDKYWTVRDEHTGKQFNTDLRRWWSTPEQAEAHANREKARAR